MSRAREAVSLGSIEIFCKAAELGAFSAAAQALGLSPPAISRAIERLETRLGVRLFARSTRQVKLTNDGRTYYEQCQQALRQLDEAERAVTGQQGDLSGTVRLSLPTTYAHYRLMPRLAEFLARNAQVQVELHIANDNVDFIEQGFDLAIRMGEPRDNRLIARRLEDATLGLFAAPDYLKRHGTPKTLSDLSRHELIQFIRPSTGRAMPWLLRDGKRVIEHEFTSRQRVLGDVLGCVRLVRAGAGICQIYHFIAEDAARRGELVEILPALAGASRPFCLLYPQQRHVPARVRALIDFLSEPVKVRDGKRASR